MAIMRRAARPISQPTVTRVGPTSVVLTDQLGGPAPAVYRNVDYSSGINFTIPTYGGGGGGMGYPQVTNANDAVAQGGYALCMALFGNDAACRAAQSVVDNLTGGNGGGSNLPTVNGTSPCRAGFVLGPDGICYAQSSPGYNEEVLGAGGVVAGVFGAPAEAPRAVGSISNDRGEVHPILRCLPGRVLGKDNMCYAKGSIPNKLRKWPKEPRPPITRRDAVAIRRAESAKNRVKKLAGDVGFTCKKR